MTSLSKLINVSVLPTGRRIVAIREVRTLAVQLGHTSLVHHLDGCLSHDGKARRLEVDWRNQRDRPVDAGPVAELDLAGDRVLSAIHTAAETTVKANVPGTPVVAAKKLLDEVFPSGLSAIVQKVVEVQWTEVDILLERFEGVLLPHVQALHLEPHVAELKRINGEMKNAMRTAGPALLTWKQVQTARAVGHQLMMEAVARVIGFYPVESDDQARKRAELLAPIHAQAEEVRLSRRGRRSATDLNPETGAVELTDDPPAE